MRIGVVGDIHGNFFDLKEAIGEMGRIDQLLFTGDGYRDISRMVDLLDIPITGVRGNCDFYTEYPLEQIIYLGKIKVLLTHGHNYGVKQDLTKIGLAAQEKGCQLVVFGHTHQPLSDQWHGIKLFNPGALSRERSVNGPSYGLVEIADSQVKLNNVRLKY